MRPFLLKGQKEAGSTEVFVDPQNLSIDIGIDIDMDIDISIMAQGWGSWRGLVARAARRVGPASKPPVHW